MGRAAAAVRRVCDEAGGPPPKLDRIMMARLKRRRRRGSLVPGERVLQMMPEELRAEEVTKTSRQSVGGREENGNLTSDPPREGSLERAKSPSRRKSSTESRILEMLSRVESDVGLDKTEKKPGK